MELRGSGENSSGGHGPEEIEEKVGEDERGKVINGEGFLKTIGRRLPLGEQCGCIVDQDIDPGQTSMKFCGQAVDLRLRRQVREE